ncbi:MAG TPA: metal-dependent hydrolase, partial [Ktedonobacteraceae bacterium]|nr:metal-dependent hydrolase [Ktedonobacteraceae bacterium]
SILGLFLGSAIALGVEQLIRYLLVSRGYVPSADSITRTHMILIAVLFGTIMHILADALTIEGVPLFWPVHKYIGFPPVRDWRFRTGTWPEYVIVYAFMIGTAVALYYGVILI